MTSHTREQKVAEARTRMAELAAKFLDRTDADIASMRGALDRMAAGDAAALGDIEHLAHRMVGTGAMLGFESLSELAARIEKLANGCVPGTLPGETIRAQFACALEALATELARQRG